MLKGKSGTHYVALAGLIAALYAALTVAAMQIMGYLSWGLVQFRISEALVILPLLFPAAVPGLTLGCVVANIMNLAVAGPMGWLDVVFGSLATLLGALWTRKFRKRPALALLGPVLMNALVVPAYLPLILKGMGLYTIPFTTMSIESSYVAMYLFGVVSVGIGEAVVVYALGLPLYKALQRSAFVRELVGREN